MDVQPIFAALRKHRIPAGLIVLEIALACAVLCNAVFMIGQRVGEMHVPNAIDEAGIVDIGVQGANPQLASADVPRNLAALREIAGVTAVAAINIVPLDQNGWNANVATKPGELMAKDSPNVAQYMFSRGGPEALGMHLVQGRWFNDAEYANGEIGASYLPSGSAVLVTHSLAERLWPGQSALGKQVWIGNDNHYQVVGVVADVLRPNQNGEVQDQTEPAGPTQEARDNVCHRNQPQSPYKPLASDAERCHRQHAEDSHGSTHEQDRAGNAGRRVGPRRGVRR